FEPASPGIIGAVKAAKSPRGYMEINTYNEDLTKPAGHSKRYSAGMILGEDETFNLTIQVSEGYGLVAATKSKVLLGYVIVETNALTSGYAGFDMSKYLSYPEYKNNPTADYVPYPYLTILNYTTHGRNGVSTTGVERGTIYAKNAPTTLMNTPLVYAESKAKLGMSYDFTNDLTWVSQSKFPVIGYVSGTQQCAFEILPDVRCTGNTVERKVKTVACTETWETDTVCTNQQQCVSGECKPIISCQDPDGKEGYDTATTTTGPTDSAKLTVSETKADSCASTALLTEYYCDGGTTGIIKSATKSCNCINGACVKLSCTETDTGKDTTKTGTTTGPLTKYDTTPTTKTDTCSGSTLTEYYCDTTTRLIASTTAIGPCKNGAIVTLPACTDP
ncbi:MAG: hypothetical protein AAB356_07955, partial [Deltaproteobacteria bacterium]